VTFIREDLGGIRKTGKGKKRIPRVNPKGRGLGTAHRALVEPFGSLECRGTQLPKPEPRRGRVREMTVPDNFLLKGIGERVENPTRREKRQLQVQGRSVCYCHLLEFYLRRRGKVGSIWPHRPVKVVGCWEGSAGGLLTRGATPATCVPFPSWLFLRKLDHGTKRTAGVAR